MCCALLTVAACSGSGSTARRASGATTWNRWVKVFCADELAFSNRIGAGSWFVPDSRAYHHERRLVPAITVSSREDAYALQGAALATLQELVAATRGERARLRALGTPTSPRIRNGARIAANYAASVAAIESSLHELGADSQQLDVNDLPGFRTKFAALRFSTLHALEAGFWNWSHAQTLDTTHAVEHLFRADKDCYWLGD